MKVSELSGAALDYWVAAGENLPGACIIVHENACVYDDGSMTGAAFRPSRDPEQGEAIIEKFGIQVTELPSGTFRAEAVAATGDPTVATGATRLEAAMRCYLKARFGEEVPT